VYKNRLAYSEACEHGKQMKNANTARQDFNDYES
jgi:hypothetical protein